MAEAKIESELDFRKLVPVLVVVLVDVLGLTILIPVLPYYAIAFGADAFTIGLLGSAYPAMQFLFAPILGGLSDRIGRKPVLATAQMGTFVSLLILGFSNALWVVFLSRILDGITGANLSTAQSVITDSTDESNRARGLGLIGATFGVGFVIGPALSGLALWLSGNNYSAPAFLAAGFAFVSVILTTFVLEETHPPEKRGKSETSSGLNFGRMK
ncbi:MAG: MFS transporter, partial [Chloroflexota bacterium]